MKTLPIRNIHPENWHPTGRDIADIYKYLRETVVSLAEEFSDEEFTVEAVQLLCRFCNFPFEMVKPDIIEHFTECYNVVGGDIEGCYKDQQLLRLLRTVLCPDPMTTKGV